MVQHIRKCQSKKHGLGGCGDPRCPEGLSIQKAMDDALNNKDILSYLDAKTLQSSKPTSLFIEKGLASLYIKIPGESYDHRLQFIANRPEVKAYIDSLDRTNIKSFQTIESFENHLNDTYRPYASIHLREYEGYGPEENITRLSVANMSVDADLRGSGIGSYFRKTLLKYADEHGCVVSGTPTNSGDGTMDRTDENEQEYKEYALNHRARLEHFYLRTGYERNYGTEEVRRGTPDYWTKKPVPQNPEWLNRFNEEGLALLWDAGAFIRWPNNTIPASLLK